MLRGLIPNMRWNSKIKSHEKQALGFPILDIIEELNMDVGVKL